MSVLYLRSCATFLLFLFCMVFETFVPAVTHADDAALLNPIYIDESATANPRFFTQSDTRIFEAHDFKDRTTPLGDWIERESGLRVTQSGSNASTVSIRGSTSDQVAIYMNGVLLNPASSSAIDLSRYSLENVSRIKIYKGKTPLSAGGEPIGGAIFIESDSSRNQTQAVTGQLDYGSFNTIHGAIGWRETRAKHALDLHYGMTHSDGDFSFLDDNGTPGNETDDARVTRENNVSDTHHADFNFRFSPNDRVTIRFFERFFRRDQGVPGLGTFQSQVANLSETESLSDVTLTIKDLLLDHTRYTAKTAFIYNKSQFSDPNAEIGIGKAQDNDTDTLQVSHHQSFELPLSDMFTNTVMAGYTWERFQAADFFSTPTQGPVNTRHRFQVGDEVKLTLFNERLLVSAGASYLQFRNKLNDQDPSNSVPTAAQNTRVEHTWTAASSVDVAILPDWVSLDFSVARSMRAPQFYELFGDRGAVVGNANLRSERALKLSGGVRVAHAFEKGPVKNAYFSAAYFNTDTSDLIQFVQSTSVARADNIGTSTARGFECDLDIDFLKWFRLDSTLTYQHVRDTDRDREVPGHPRTRLFTELAFEKSIRERPFKFFVNASYEDGRYLDTNNTQRVADQLELNLGTSFQVTKPIRIFVEGKNLTNTQIVDVVGFPLPGRSIVGGFAWNFSTPH